MLISFFVGVSLCPVFVRTLIFVYVPSVYAVVSFLKSLSIFYFLVSVLLLYNHVDLIVSIAYPFAVRYVHVGNLAVPLLSRLP